MSYIRPIQATTAATQVQTPTQGFTASSDAVNVGHQDQLDSEMVNVFHNIQSDPSSPDSSQNHGELGYVIQKTQNRQRTSFNLSAKGNILLALLDKVQCAATGNGFDRLIELLATVSNELSIDDLAVMAGEFNKDVSEPELLDYERSVSEIKVLITQYSPHQENSHQQLAGFNNEISHCIDLLEPYGLAGLNAFQILYALKIGALTELLEINLSAGEARQSSPSDQKRAYRYTMILTIYPMLKHLDKLYGEWIACNINSENKDNYFVRGYREKLAGILDVLNHQPDEAEEDNPA